MMGALCASLACLRVSVEHRAHANTSSTDRGVSFTTKDLGNGPSSVLDDDALAALLGFVFGDAVR